MRARKSREINRPRDRRTVSHRRRLVAELRANPQLAAQYLLAAMDDADPRVLQSALRTLAAARPRVRFRPKADTSTHPAAASRALSSAMSRRSFSAVRIADARSCSLSLASRESRSIVSADTSLIASRSAAATI